MLTTVAAGRVFNYSYCIGMYAMSGQGFWSPLDFACAANGVLYVLSRGDSEGLGPRISKCTVDHQFLGQYGGFGRGDGQFVWPVSLAVDSEENLYVSDESLQRISIFDKQGKYLGAWGTPGSAEGQLQGPAGLVFDREDTLYVVDSLNHRVQKFTREGKFLEAWGKAGSGEGELSMPWGIGLDSHGDVYVADWKNHRVQKFTHAGAFLGTFGGSEAGVGALDHPTGVAVDSEGDVYVTDWNNHRVQVYSAEGTCITALVGDAQQPSPWAQTYIDANPDIIKARRRVNLEPEWRFRRPVAVHVDAQERIFVLESARHRLQIYEKEKDTGDVSLNL
ncbi:MAG: NHL repeat-containing protein [Candidatus Tectimicrobiota bacterium]